MKLRSTWRRMLSSTAGQPHIASGMFPIRECYEALTKVQLEGRYRRKISIISE